MALTTLPDFRSQTGISSVTAPDSLVTALIAVLTDEIKRVCHQNFESKTQTEYYSGDNHPILVLRQRPIISVSRVNIDSNGNFGQSAGGFNAAFDLVQGVDYSIMYGADGLGSSGMLQRIGAVWPRYPAYEFGKVAPQPGPPRGNILVAYTSGYAVIPAALRGMVNQGLARAVNTAAIGGPMQSGAYEDASISMFNPADLEQIFGSVERMTGMFKEMVV